TADSFEFYGLEIELWRINDSPPAPMFNVIAQPNEWSREVKQKAEAATSDLKQLQQRYWQALRALLLETKSKVRPQKAHPQHWASYALGRSGTWLSACVNSQKKSVWVEFAFYGPPGKVWFDELLTRKAEIEAKVGQPLDWQRMDGKKMSRIALHRANSDFTKEEDWPAQHRWLADTLGRFHEVFRPYALALRDGVAGDPDEEAPQDEGPETD
ncbi:MAG TPA: DUF4268 domain-containing protein, partial [Phenylobacterium sp.]|nr:DUF4268 domain-containing protein [Phenylobacterium sp.]